MSIFTSENFQVKSDMIFGKYQPVKKCIGYIISNSKDNTPKHIYHIRFIFDRLKCVGLKVNTKKCSFGLKYIPYLGYLITQEGIENHPKKFQGIMDIYLPTKTTEARRLIFMVHYYREI